MITFKNGFRTCALSSSSSSSLPSFSTHCHTTRSRTFSTSSTWILKRKRSLSTTPSEPTSFIPLCSLGSISSSVRAWTTLFTRSYMHRRYAIGTVSSPTLVSASRHWFWRYRGRRLSWLVSSALCRWLTCCDSMNESTTANWTQIIATCCLKVTSLPFGASSSRWRPSVMVTFSQFLRLEGLCPLSTRFGELSLFPCLSRR